MAFEPIAWAFKNERLGGTELLVLTCMILHADAEGGSIFPSVATIQRQTGLARRTVQRAIKRLEEDRWIVPGRPKKSHEVYRNVGRCFKLNYKRLKPQGRHHDAGVTATRASKTTQEGCHSDTQSVQLTVQESVIPPDPLEGFDQWYQHYPRKVAKKAAQRAWKALKPNAELRAIILADTISREWPDEDRYKLHPATYLNGARWEDEKPPSAGEVSRGTRTKAHRGGSAVDGVRDATESWLEQRDQERGDKVIEGRFTRKD